MAITGPDQGKNKHFLTFYDPINRKCLNTIIFDGSSQRLGGSFSEQGRRFVVGQVQPLYKPQNFSVYNYSPISNTYNLLSTVPYKPSVTAYMYMPTISYDRFALEDGGKTILCYGKKAHSSTGIIDTAKIMYSLFNQGSARSLAKILAACKIDCTGKKSITAIDPKAVCQVHHSIKCGTRGAYSISSNGQHIVYVDPKNDFYHMDRATGVAKKVAQYPEIIDNTGTISLRNTVFQNRPTLLAAGKLGTSRELITHGCNYPGERSMYFGSKDTVLMDKAYCFTRNMDYSFNEYDPNRAVLAAGIVLPGLPANVSLESQASTQVHLDNFERVVSTPQSSLASLRNQAPTTTQQRIRPSFYHRALPCTPIIVGLGTCLAFAAWAHTTTKLSAEWKKRIKWLSALGSLYSAFHFCNYAIT